MIKTIVYGVVGGLLGALSAGAVKTATSVHKDYKEYKEPVDITPAFDVESMYSSQEAFSEEESDGAYTFYKSNEHKNVYLFDFESMLPRIDGRTFDEYTDEQIAMDNVGNMYIRKGETDDR